MAVRYIINVDLNEPTNGLDLKTISYLEHVHITINPETYQKSVEFLQNHSNELTVYCDCTALVQLEGVVSLLNHGANKAFLKYTQLKSLIQDGLFKAQDVHRVIISFSNADDEKESGDSIRKILMEFRHSVADVPVDIQDHGLHAWETLPAFRQRSGINFSGNRYALVASKTREDYAAAIKHGYIAIIPAKSLTLDPDEFPDLFPAQNLITTVIQSDRHDGLFPTVVVSERGDCLGLVYSSEASIEKALQLGRGVYHSRRHGLWIKGQESGNIQELISVSLDCDADALQFRVRQKGDGFCHLSSSTCFGKFSGLTRLEETLLDRKASAPIGSYTARLFNEPKLLQAKIMEEATELCEAIDKKDVAAEAADLVYFALTKCIATGVRLEEIERNLDLKSLRITRRKGDAKPQWANKVGLQHATDGKTITTNGESRAEITKAAASVPKEFNDKAGLADGKIQMKRYRTEGTAFKTISNALQRPSQRSTDQIMGIVNPIIKEVRQGGDESLLRYTHKFERATSLSSPVLRAPFPSDLMKLPRETIEAIDVSFENIRRFHKAQQEEGLLKVETMPGVVCQRFSRPIERVGLYVPGGTAVLPSTALMLGVPAMVAGCKKIVLASPPRSDGTITPEIIYVAHKVGAESIVLAGGAQAIAAMAYGTESVSKVDKILGPGNQFVTAGKMIVANDTTACVSIDMPAGPSEVLVIVDKTANPAFVASDLLSQAEHGTDSQVILIAVGLSEIQLSAIEDELHTQANALPRKDIVRGAIEHSVTLVVKNISEAMKYSNQYAPEHLILQVEDAESVVSMVENAGSVFVGPWTPESVGDYSAGVNHSLPTYGYARQYSGVNLSSFMKHITSSNLTRQGLKNVSSAVMQLAKVEELEAHRRAVSIRLAELDETAE